MKPTTRSFMWGVIVGGLATILLAITGIIVGAKLYTRHVEATLEARVTPPPVPESLAADYTWKAVSLDGAPLAMDTLQDKTVVLTFWKPDCFSCTEQLEYLETLFERMRGGAVAFAAVSVGEVEDTREAVAPLNLSLPIYVMKGERPKVYETSTLPTTFVMTPGGKVAFRYGGIARWDDPAVEAYLRALAAQPGPAD